MSSVTKKFRWCGTCRHIQRFNETSTVLYDFDCLNHRVPNGYQPQPGDCEYWEAPVATPLEGGGDV